MFFNTFELPQRALASKVPLGIPGVRFWSKFQSTPHDGRTVDVICTRLKEGTVQHKKDGNGWCVALSFHRRRGGVETALTRTSQNLIPLEQMCAHRKNLFRI